MDVRDMLRRFSDCAEPLRKRTEEVYEFWGEDVPPNTVAAGEMGWETCEVIDLLTDSEMKKIADLVEQMCGEGDDVATAVMTGFLEAFVARATEKESVVKFVRMLGPESRAYCEAWDRFTGVVTPGLESAVNHGD